MRPAPVSSRYLVSADRSAWDSRWMSQRRAAIRRSRTSRESSASRINSCSGPATSCARAAPEAAFSTTSRHHCSRISAISGSFVTQGARATSRLKAYNRKSRARAAGGAAMTARNRSGSPRWTRSAQASMLTAASRYRGSASTGSRPEAPRTRRQRCSG